MRNWRVGRLDRPARLSLCAAILLGGVVVPPASATAVESKTTASAQGESVDSFYEARGNRPLWFGDPSERPVAPALLIDLLNSAGADGLDTRAYRPGQLDQAVREAGSGNFAALDRADRMLSEVFVAYVRDMKRTPRIDMVWVDPSLRPSVASPRQLLEDVAAASSPQAYLAKMQWMNPLYAALRQAIAGGAGEDGKMSNLLALNLERARALPSDAGRYIIVNTSAAQLSMYEGGKVVDTMRVVVGKPVYPTPMMAAFIRFTSLNPYWNVPPDLAAERIAPNVLKDGRAYLKAKGYQVLSSWDEGAEVIDPQTVDWAGVAAGREQVRIRQLPGAANAMGKMKFMFPNAQGVYLHDTPEKNLLGEETRMFSGGCVRLEDAPRLARWLYNGAPPSARSSRPEQRVDLPKPVPVFLTYLTAVPSGAGIAYLPDVYGRDRAALAALGPQGDIASR